MLAKQLYQHAFLYSISARASVQHTLNERLNQILAEALFFQLYSTDTDKKVLPRFCGDTDFLTRIDQIRIFNYFFIGIHQFWIVHRITIKLLGNFG